MAFTYTMLVTLLSHLLNDFCQADIQTLALSSDFEDHYHCHSWELSPFPERRDAISGYLFSISHQFLLQWDRSCQLFWQKWSRHRSQLFWSNYCQDGSNTIHLALSIMITLAQERHYPFSLEVQAAHKNVFLLLYSLMVTWNEVINFFIIKYAEKWRDASFPSF